MKRLSAVRTWAIALKELQQMLRDRMTFAMAIGIPVLQLVLFGYVIDTDPKGLPLAVVAHEQSPFSRSLVAALENSGYFRLVGPPAESESDAEALIASGEAQFVLAIPADFSRRLVRGERPALLLAVDASDPSAAANAVAALGTLGATALAHDLQGPLAHLRQPAAPFEFRVQRRYNPEGLSRYNIVPGLIGTILTMTMVMLTALAMTRERERGTMENLLATPVRPLEVMLGKIAPYVVVGYVQIGLILLAARVLFEVPMVGSLPLLMAPIGVFVLANLAVGFTFSTLARNQLQALQATFFFFLPSMLLSGFMFPFRGMPRGAQWIGEALPLTHFLRIVRGVMLKGIGGAALWVDVWPMLAFAGAAGGVALLRYRRTLD